MSSPLTLSLAAGVLTVSGGDCAPWTLQPSGGLNLMGLVQDSIQCVTLGSGLTALTDACFRGLPNLVHVSLPDGLTEIGASAFERCSALRQIRLPDSVLRIGVHAFSDCTALTQVSLPAALTEIQAVAFAGCTALTSLRLPRSLRTIGEYAFYQCPLPSIVLPEYVAEIGPHAFEASVAIHGWPGSAAEAFARTNGNSFTALS